jgi:hypothetical protein
MTICETLPLCRDTTLNEETSSSLTEPIEVGPYREGIVFVKATAVTERAVVSARVGISPTGYENWSEHWTVSETRSIEEAGMHAVEVTNFGNWLRLRFELIASSDDADDEITLVAWFVGKG